MRVPENLLEDREVFRWHSNIARKSLRTADEYLNRLNSFCRSKELTPSQLLELEDIRLRNLILDFITELELRGKTGGYTANIVKAVKSWLKFNGRDITFKFYIKGINESRIAETEVVPTKHELKKVLMAADLRERAAIVMMAFGALRPETLGNYRGDDCLRLQDLPDLKVYGEEVEFIRTPAQVVVRPNLSKMRHQYFTFLAEEACEYLRDYLMYRIRKGEELKGASAVISPVARAQWGRPLTTAGISSIIRKAIKRAGFSWRPYIFRHFADTWMLRAESAGLIVRDYRVFFMGHKGDIEHRYTLNKHTLPDDLIMDLRSSYERASVLLTGPHETEDIVKEEQKQKVVSADEIEEYLEKGWEYVTTLPDS